MKKICYVTTISATLKAFVLDTAKYLHAKGDYEITFICDLDDEFARSLPDYIHFLPVPMKRGISFSGVKAVFRLIFIFFRNRFDLVQYSTPNASLYASLAAKMARIPVRLYCQWGIVYVGFSGMKRSLFKLIEKLICAFSTFIEPDSFGNLAFSHAEGLYSPHKSTVVWNGSASGVNLKKFDIAHKAAWRNEIRKQYNLKDDTRVLGFVGRITREKGINELFEACRRFFDVWQDTVLMLVGDIEKADTIDEYLYKWSISEDRIIYAGRTNQVEKYLSAMDLFILPSYREGFGTVVIEAEAMGVPVIVTDIPGPSDAMEPDKTGFIVKKKDVETLLAAMCRAFSDPEMMKAMSANAVGFAAEKYDQEILFSQILENRDQLIQRRRLQRNS